MPPKFPTCTGKPRVSISNIPSERRHDDGWEGATISCKNITNCTYGLGGGRRELSRTKCFFSVWEPSPGNGTDPEYCPDTL